MPIIKSAKKRVRVAKVKSAANAKTKKALRTALKAFQAAVSSGKKIEETQNAVQSALDTAVKKGVMDKNKAARRKSQLNAQAKAASGGKRTAVAKKAVKPAPSKPAAKKAAAAPKKSPAKKPAAKKK